MDNRKSRSGNRKFKKRTKSFTEALKEKYCMDDEPTFDFIIVSPKRRSNTTEAELAHLRTVVLNEMDVTFADIPKAGLTSLCPNVVDLDLANNLLESWHELIAILGDLPRVKYVNLSGNKLRLQQKEILPNTRLSVENLALNATGSTLEEVVRLSHMMPSLKELHLCGNDYTGLADIDNKISSGAFSALECMRLNNNGITSWSEVWKLRHLPQLKYLILSGNPIEDIFYNEVNANSNSNNKDKTEITSDTSNTTRDLLEANQTGLDMDTTADLELKTDDHAENRFKQDADEGDVDEEDEEGEDEDFDVGGSSYCEEDEEDVDTDCFDDRNDSSLEGRPVSRFGYHQDPDIVDSEDGSDVEQDWVPSSVTLPATTSSAPVISSNINIPQTSGANKNIHNTNFNNSRSSLPNRTSPFDDSSSGSSNLTPLDLSFEGFPDLLGGPALLPSPDAYIDLEGEEDNPGDWPRLAAEQFLYDLIDQLDLGETTVSSTSSTSSSTHSTLFTSATSSLTSQSVSALTMTSLSSSATAPPQSLPQWYGQHSPLAYQTSVHTTPSVQSSTSSRAEPVFSSLANTNQNAAFVTEISAEENINKMLAAVDNDTAGSDVEEDVFARIYTDEDFIPRSVSMFDDEESYSPPSMPLRLDDIILSPGKSKAQRCLFGEPSSVTQMNNVAAPNNQRSTPNALPSESERDSCSDCEAEQHGLTTTLRRELAEANEAIARPGAGANSWLEMNRSFATSVRDSGEGYSITTSQTQGARVVVTGLNYNNANRSLLDCDSTNVRESMNICESSSNLSTQTQQQSDFSRSSVCSGEGQSNIETDNANQSRPTNEEKQPFHQLQMLCLSNASVSHWNHLKACTDFPMLNNIRLKNNPLYSSVNSDDRRKLYIASLPKVTVLNGGEVTAMEREKAERFFLRYFMDSPEKPELYHTLVAKHGPPVQLVDIDLGAGYQEWATLTFKCEGAEHFTRRLHLVEPVARLRTLVSQVLGLPKWCFMLHHHPCGPSHPECEREIVELRCESLPMSRFDFAEGDEIIVDVRG